MAGLLKNLAPEISGVGPAFDVLNARRQRFVIAYVGRGRRNAAGAYKDAGFTASTDHSAAANACLLLHRDDVQAAIREWCQKQLVTLAPVATEVMATMLEDPQTDPAVRAKLVGMVFDRTGLAAVTEQKITVEHIGSDPQALNRARTLIEQLKLSDAQVETMFGRSVAAKIIEADYVEIPSSEAPAKPDSEGAAAPSPEGAAEPENIQAALKEMLQW